MESDGGESGDGGPPSSSPLDNVPEPAQEAISTANAATSDAALTLV